MRSGIDDVNSGSRLAQDMDIEIPNKVNGKDNPNQNYNTHYPRHF